MQSASITLYGDIRTPELPSFGSKVLGNLLYCCVAVIHAEEQSPSALQLLHPPCMRLVPRPHLLVHICRCSPCTVARWTFMVSPIR